MAPQFAATYQTYQIRSWQSADRQSAAQVIAQVLAEYGLGWEPEGADRDVLAIETDYQLSGGEFWVVEAALSGPLPGGLPTPPDGKCRGDSQNVPAARGAGAGTGALSPR
jgi:hypothetical protein